MVSCSDETCAVRPEVTGETLEEGAEAWNRRDAVTGDMLAALRQAYLSLECRPELRRTAGIVASAIEKAEGRL
ncbi:hypothetical protein VP06_14625 [Methylobacterium aquaticum]|uniref:Uncharacterized protein n=2 Tax=Methylobacterium aquaticum TaxID=270351 RepID=A0A0J6SL07_9HYPH|nr:hypothetical protein VP06_14625 [Methylobacterium aquaticum]